MIGAVVEVFINPADADCVKNLPGNGSQTSVIVFLVVNFQIWREIVRKYIALAWNYTFDHEVSPLRHIPDFNVRHMVLQMLGWMWAISFSIAIGSYTFLAVSLIGHVVLLGAVAITAATYSTAANRPKAFLALARR